VLGHHAGGGEVALHRHPAVGALELAEAADGVHHGLLVLTEEAGPAVVDDLGGIASIMTMPNGSFHRMGNSSAEAPASSSSFRSWDTSPR
jgi:hypothetical protein